MGGGLESQLVHPDQHPAPFSTELFICPFSPPQDFDLISYSVRYHPKRLLLVSPNNLCLSIALSYDCVHRYVFRSEIMAEDSNEAICPCMMQGIEEFQEVVFPDGVKSESKG